jgi:hypothetical protein
VCEKIRPEDRICHPAWMQHVSSSFARAKGRDGLLPDGIRGGCECLVFAENILNYEGDCAFRKRHGVSTMAFKVPSGALVDFRPPAPFVKELPPMGPSGLPVMFVGNHEHPLASGQSFKDCLVTPLYDSDSSQTTSSNVLCPVESIFLCRKLMFASSESSKVQTYFSSQVI